MSYYIVVSTRTEVVQTKQDREELQQAYLAQPSRL